MEEDKYTREELEPVFAAYKGKLSSDEISAILDKMNGAGLIDHGQSSVAPNLMEKGFQDWKARVAGKPVEHTEGLGTGDAANAMAMAVPMGTKTWQNLAADVTSIFDRASGAIAKTLGVKSAADERGMADPNASVLKGVHGKINESNLPPIAKIPLNVATSVVEGLPAGLVKGLASSATRSILPAIKGGFKAGSAAKASELAAEAATAKSSMIGPAPVTGDIAKDAANLSVNKLNVPVPTSTSPMSFTSGEKAQLSGSADAAAKLGQEAKIVSGARGNDMEAANVPFDTREASLASQHGSATQNIMLGSELTGKAVATNLAETSDKLKFIYKPAYNKAEKAANEAVTTKPIVDDLVSELDSKGLYKVSEEGPTNLSPTTKTSTTIKDVVKLDENGKPLQSTGKDKILRRATGSQTNTEEGDKLSSSLTTKAESWVGGKTPNQAKSATSKEMKTTLGMKADGFSASDAVSEGVAKNLANIRNEIAEAGNFSSLKNALDKLYDLRRKSVDNVNAMSGDYEAYSEAIASISKAKTNALKRSGLEGDWEEMTKVYKADQDLEDIKKAIGTEGFNSGFDVKNVDGDKIFDKIIGAMVDKDSGRNLMVLQALVVAEENGILAKGIKNNINQTMMRKIIDKSTSEAQSTGDRIVSADKLYKNIMDTPKQVFDLAMTEDNKKELLRLYVDAAAHSKATQASAKALEKSHNIDKIAQVAHSLKIYGWASGNRTSVKTGAVTGLLSDFMRIVAGKTSNQILRKYAGSSTAGTLGDRIGDAVRGLNTFVKAGTKGGLSAMHQAGKDAFTASRSKLVPPALSTISAAQDATATEQ